MFSDDFIRFNSFFVLTILIKITFNVNCQNNYAGFSIDVQNTEFIDNVDKIYELLE